mgnify:CR=1 FL=1
MSKAVMLSIRPKWVEKIASGKKTIEVRKTRPKLETPFKCYIYCTKPKYEHEDFIRTDYPKPQFYGGGKVIGEFTCDRIFPINVFDNGGIQNWFFEHMERSCLTYEELADYIGNGRTGHGWHISNLKIYDTPKELIEFHTWKKCKSCSKSGYESTACIYDENCMIPAAITKAPQSWCYVEAM